MAIFFLRHAKTVNNLKDIISGRIETEILPDTNLVLDGNVSFEYIYCSTYKRCRDTIAMLPTHMYNGKINFAEELQERSVGFLEGMEREVAMELYPHLFHQNKLSVNAEIEGGETIQDVQNRIEEVVQDIIIKGTYMNVLVCSHNQTLKVIYAMIHNIEITDEYWANTNFLNGTIVRI